MDVLVIADAYLPVAAVTEGTAALVEAGHQVNIQAWGPATAEELQEINLAVEQRGANAVELPVELQQQVRAADVVITQFAPIGTKLIESAPRLKYIGVMRGGVENVDQAAADARGVVVVNTPGRNARAVAEFTIGLIIAETRNIARTHAAMRQHVWLKDFPNAGQIRELENRVLGVIGAGAIGELVMRFAAAMGMKCQFYDPYRQASDHGVKVDDLARLMSSSDVVSIHSRLVPETHHLVSAEMLALMKPTAVLVNTARSGLVDEQALLVALQENRIMGAAIDTFDIEPLPADSPWLSLENVTITSHLAGTTLDAFSKTPRLLCMRLLSIWEKG